jgi:hypothetical protein
MPKPRLNRCVKIARGEVDVALHRDQEPPCIERWCKEMFLSEFTGGPVHYNASVDPFRNRWPEALKLP